MDTLTHKLQENYPNTHINTHILQETIHTNTHTPGNYTHTHIHSQPHICHTHTRKSHTGMQYTHTHTHTRKPTARELSLQKYKIYGDL